MLSRTNRLNAVVTCCAMLVSGFLAPLLFPLTAEPLPAFDLSAFRPGETGRQGDAGVVWPDHFLLRGLVLVPVVEDVTNGRIYMADPEALREGKAELHHWLFAYDGVVVGKERGKQLVREEVRRRLLQAWQTQLHDIATNLPPQAADLGAKLVAQVITGLVH